MPHHRPNTLSLPNYTSSLTLPQAARLLHMSPNTLKRHIDAGKLGNKDQLVTLTRGGHWRLNPAVIKRYIRTNAAQQTLDLP